MHCIQVLEVREKKPKQWNNMESSIRKYVWFSAFFPHDFPRPKTKISMNVKDAWKKKCNKNKNHAISFQLVPLHFSLHMLLYPIMISVFKRKKKCSPKINLKKFLVHLQPPKPLFSFPFFFGCSPPSFIQSTQDEIWFQNVKLNEKREKKYHALNSLLNFLTKRIEDIRLVTL